MRRDQEQRATVALSPGDALNDVADWSVATAVGRWNQYLALETPRLSDFMPIWRVGGDNDRLDLATRLTAYNQVNSYLPTSPDASRRWYSRDIGNLHVVFLSSAYADHTGFIGYVFGDGHDQLQRGAVAGHRP